MIRDILQNNLYKSDLKRACEKINLSKLSNTSILITGGLGLICSAVIDLLIASKLYYNFNINIYVACRDKQSFDKRYGNYPVHFVPYDACKSFHFDFKIDYIIHGAGPASPELYVNIPVETMLANFIGVQNLLDYSVKNSVKRLLYVSSSEVYGTKTNDNAFFENEYGSVDIDNIRTSYSESKRAAELLCRSYSKEYDVDTVIVRPGHVFGPSASSKDNRLSSAFIFDAVKGNNLELKSSGLQKRSYCYSLDCAIAILNVLLFGEKAESYNVGHCDITTIKQLTNMIANSAGVSMISKEPTESEIKAFNPMNNSSVNISKIINIGYSDTFSVEEGIDHTVRIIKACYYS